MRGVLRWWPAVLAACWLVVAATSRAAEVDERVYRSLRDVINTGADLYNSGDSAGCYRLYQGALLAVRPLLDDHPEWQKAIDEGFTAAEAETQQDQRAFVLRRVIDRIRSDVHAHKGTPMTTEATNPDKKTPDRTTPDRTPRTPKDTTLWDRLGGEKGVARVVDDFTALAAKDPKIDFTRGGKYKLSEDDINHLKKEMIDFISEHTGGPYKYTGKSMKEEHKGMKITEAEFDASLQDLRTVLHHHDLKAEDEEAVLKAAESTRKDIVEKKTEDKKPQDKKPEDKKPEDKKPQDKKPEDKKPEKPENKKPEDKKPEDRKPEDKKPEDKKPEKTEDKKPQKTEDKKPEDRKPQDKKPEDRKPADSKDDAKR